VSFLNGPDSGLRHIFKGGHVWLPNLQVDDLSSGRFQGLSTGQHIVGPFWGQVMNTVGKNHFSTFPMILQKVTSDLKPESLRKRILGIQHKLVQPRDIRAPCDPGDHGGENL